jgi:hypothetical protein
VHQGRFPSAWEIRRKPKGKAPNRLEGRPQPPLNPSYGEVAEWSIAADLGRAANPRNQFRMVRIPHYGQKLDSMAAIRKAVSLS